MKTGKIKLTRGKRTGIKLLELGMLICCIISLINTAVGLYEYVYKDSDYGIFSFVVSFSLSFVFQCIIAVTALKWKEMKTKGIIVCIVWLLAFAASVFFDMIFIINSTYNVTKADESLTGITTMFNDIKGDISGWLGDGLESSASDLYQKIGAVYMDAPEIGATVYEKPWTEYWDEQRKYYGIEGVEQVNPDGGNSKWLLNREENNINYTFYEFARNSLIYKWGASSGVFTGKTMEKQDVDDYKYSIVRYSAYNYVVNIINAATVAKPGAANDETIKRIKTLAEEAKAELNNIINLENEWNSKPDKSEKYSREKSPAEQENESFNNEMIFAKMRKDYLKQLEEFETLSDEEKKQKSDEISTIEEAAKLCTELSQKNIEICRRAIADIDEYIIYIESIQNDAKYNIAQLVAEISETKILDINQVNEIASKIGQAIFAGEQTSDQTESQTTSLNDDIKEKIIHFTDMTNALAVYVPLKNLNYILSDFTLVSNDADSSNEEIEIAEAKDSEEGKKDKNKEVSNDDSNCTGIVSEEEKKDEYNKNNSEFNEQAIKYQVNILMQNLSAIPVGSKTEAQKKNGDNISSVYVNEDDVKGAIKKLVALEELYLNKKNPITTALNHFNTMENRYIKLVGMKSKENLGVNILTQSRLPAIFAIILSIGVDILSIILGTIIQNWKKKKEE